MSELLAPQTVLGPALDQARIYAEQSASDNTKRAYRADWAIFTQWCEQRLLTSLPALPASVAAFVADEAERRSVATLERRLVALSQAHRLAGHESPTKFEAVRCVMKGIRRAKGTAQTQKREATLDVVRLMLATLGDDMQARRDRALLLVGYAGAFRRSELVSLDVADLEFTQQGVIITLRHSKTDQEGQGTQKAIPYGKKGATCPVRALKAWLEASGVSGGAVFRRIDRHGALHGRLTAQSVALIVKRCAEAAGLEPEQFAGHSLRAGLPTDAAAAGVQQRDIKQQTGHRSDKVLERYIRRGSLFRNNAAGQVGL